jgi:phosphoglycolate phosphatase-like HAD superfamily hydrolase
MSSAFGERDTAVHLVVFDIDGTLVDSDEFDGELYAGAIRKVLETDVDCRWGRYTYVTDSGILDEILVESQISGVRDTIQMRVRAEFVRMTQEYLARNPEALREIRGAKALFEKLRQQPFISLAVATGGWRETAELKLRGIGLEPDTIPLASSSDSHDRREIIRLAERRALNGQAAVRRTYIGNGTWDKEAASALGYDFVGIGNRVVHEIVFPDLTDHAGILDCLGCQS